MEDVLYAFYRELYYNPLFYQRKGRLKHITQNKCLETAVAYAPNVFVFGIAAGACAKRI